MTREVAGSTTSLSHADFGQGVHTRMCFCHRLTRSRITSYWPNGSDTDWEESIAWQQSTVGFDTAVCGLTV